MTSLKKKDQLGPEVTARLQVQTLHKDRYKVALIAKTLDLNRTYCYSLLQDLPQKERPNKDAEIKQAIIRICIQFPTYGYRRVIAVLRNRSSRAPSTGRKCSGSCRKKASPYRSKNVLRSAPKNQAARSARSNEHFQVDMTKVWCGVRVAGGYLFAVIDAFAREIIGWAFSPRCTTDILLEAVDMALNHRFPHGTRDQNLTIRSDNGCQMFKPNVNALSAARLRHNPRTDRLQQPSGFRPLLRGGSAR